MSIRTICLARACVCLHSTKLVFLPLMCVQNEHLGYRCMTFYKGILMFQETSAGYLTLTALFAIRWNEPENEVHKTDNCRHFICVESPQLGTFRWESLFVYWAFLSLWILRVKVQNPCRIRIYFCAINKIQTPHFVRYSVPTLSCYFPPWELGAWIS